MYKQVKRVNWYSDEGSSLSSVLSVMCYRLLESSKVIGRAVGACCHVNQSTVLIYWCLGRTRSQSDTRVLGWRNRACDSRTPICSTNNTHTPPAGINTHTHTHTQKWTSNGLTHTFFPSFHTLHTSKITHKHTLKHTYNFLLSHVQYTHIVYLPSRSCTLHRFMLLWYKSNKKNMYLI